MKYTCVSFCVCVVINARKQYKKPVATYRSLFELSASEEPWQWWSLCHSIDALCRSVRDYTPQCRLFPIVHRWDDEIRMTCRIWKWLSWGAQYDHLRRFTHWNVWPELHTNVHFLGVGTGIRGVQNSEKYGSSYTYVMPLGSRETTGTVLERCTRYCASGNHHLQRLL